MNDICFGVQKYKKTSAYKGSEDSNSKKIKLNLTFACHLSHFGTAVGTMKMTIKRIENLKN